MNRFREFMKERSFMRYSMFLVFNAFLLYVLYFLVKNLDKVAVVGYRLLGTVLAALSPLLIGLVIAYLLNPLVTMLDQRLMQRFFVRLPKDPVKAEKRRNLSRSVSVLLTFLIVLAALAAIIYGFSVMILGQFVFQNLPGTMNNLFHTLLNYVAEVKKWVASTFSSNWVSDKFMTIIDGVLHWISDNFSAKTAMGAVTGAVGGVINLIIGIIIAIYLMKDKDFFLGLWRKLLHLLLPQRANAAVTETLREVNGILSQFVRGALLDALLVGILSSVGLSILGLEFAVFIGVFAGIANVIPYFGPLLGMVPAFIVGFMTENFGFGLLAVLVLVVIQQIDANVIYPKVVGSSTGLHPLVVLLAISVFGYFGGILWMILAVPITGILQAFLLKWVNKREKKISPPKGGKA